MTILDRIHISALNLVDTIEFNAAFHRVAGGKSNNTEDVSNTSDDNSTSNASENDATTTASASNETADASSSKAKSKKEKAQAAKAEAESPGEAVGAETIKSEAAPVGEAAMTPNHHIKDNNPGEINLGGGVVIDMNAMSGKNTRPSDFVNPANIVMQQGYPPQQPTMVNPMLQHQFMQQQAAMQAQQMYQSQIPNEPVVQNQFANEELIRMQQQVSGAAPTGYGNHKVDNTQKKPVVKKAEADNVNVDMSNIHIDANPVKPQKQWPDAVATPLPEVTDPVVQVNTPHFDNSAITSKRGYMADIEKIALECGVQVQMIERMSPNGQPSKLISCIVYTPGSDKPNPYKGFTVDTGTIIDARAKVFPGIVPYGYEDMQSYPILVPKPNNGSKGKQKNMVNRDLFVNLFTGGVANLNPRGMYNHDYMELNKCVALITMPSHQMSRDIRKSIQDRLMAAMKAGVFAAALKHDPNSRWRFEDFNKDTKEFVLTNAGVPFRFGGQVLSTKKVDISFTKDGVNVLA